MNKKQKWFLILIVIIPVIIIWISFLAIDVSVTDFPLWFIIGMPILILATPLIFLSAQRFAKRNIENAPLHKKKKRLLAVFGAYTTFIALILIFQYCNDPQSVWAIAIPQAVFIPFLYFFVIRRQFPKKKDSTEDDDQTNLE